MHIECVRYTTLALVLFINVKKWNFGSMLRHFFLCTIINVLMASAVFSEVLEEEIGGLVLDRSISRFGKEFYREYSILWQEVKGTSGFNVAVVESVIPRSGTVLWLEIDHVKVFQTYFGRRNSTTVKHTAETAVKYAVRFLSNKTYQSDSSDMLGDGY